MNVLGIINDIEQNLFLPKELISCHRNEFTQEYVYKVRYGIIDDCSVLSCGCCISDSLYQDITARISDKYMRCPMCDNNSVTIVGPVKQLRNLYHQLKFFAEQQKNQSKQTRSMVNSSEELSSSPIAQTDDDITMHKSPVSVEQLDTTASDITNVKEMSSQFPYGKHDYMASSPNKQKSLLSLFHMVASRLNSDLQRESTSMDIKDTVLSTRRQHTYHSEGSEGEMIEHDQYTNSEDLKVLDNASNTRTVPISQDSMNASIKNNPQNLVPSVSTDEEKEYYFAKCFPVYRRRSQFNTHSKFLRTKSKLFINMSISPDCTKFALITEHRWEVYTIPNDSSNPNPIMLFCGRSTGEYGVDFDHLKFPKDKTVLLTRDNCSSQKESWEHLYCKLSNDFLVISGAKKRFRIFDLNQNGQPIYSYCSTFPIRCIDIDTNSNVIACGITGRDRNTGAEQALIVFHKIGSNKITSEPEFFPPTTITLPYRDPINTLQFSDDGLYLSCSTALESRFLIISLKKINEPRLIMKSLRSIDTSLESEGITDTKLFPGNPNLMCVTSTAFNAPPIVINTKIQNIDGVQTVAQPTMLIRLDELGSKIHKCEISPRNDSIAFLDRNGSVYIMFAPTMMDNEKRRIVLVEMVANAYRAHESAALRFSSDGHKLYVLDRKGILYIEDFSYGLPQGHEVTKCKQIN